MIHYYELLVMTPQVLFKPYPIYVFFQVTWNFPLVFTNKNIFPFSFLEHNVIKWDFPQPPFTMNVSHDHCARLVKLNVAITNGNLGKTL